MKKNNLFNILLFVLFVIILIAGCTDPGSDDSDDKVDTSPGKYSGEPILGKWLLLETSSTKPTMDIYFTFKSDGSGVYDMGGTKGSFTYDLNGSQIIFNSYATGFTNPYIWLTYIIEENVDDTILKITGDLELEKQ